MSFIKIKGQALGRQVCLTMPRDEKFDKEAS